MSMKSRVRSVNTKQFMHLSLLRRFFFHLSVLSSALLCPTLLRSLCSPLHRVALLWKKSPPRSLPDPNHTL